ncbi:MAG TPA: VOC family protein [Syntrophorhabdaceae bacterium]|jgi:predicted 3-demethylubiquinone-9 3-methyltransferase (glyoxalase superfamily)
MQKISPFLWFDDNAEEAVKFYTSVFKNSKLDRITRYGEAGPGPQGAVMMLSFTLNGQDFVALNGGPVFRFSPAISFVIYCETQAEVDYYWEKLSEGGEKGQCGWINRDKFGISWQVVPEVLMEMLADEDKEKVHRVMRAMLKMEKIDIRTLEQAYRQ